MSNEKIYNKVTEQILGLIDKQAILPWQKSWSFAGGNVPMNYVSKKPYRGFNAMITAFSGFNSPYWMTANQIKKAGGSWSGKGTIVTFWKFIEKRDKKTKELTGDKIPLLKHYYVWNAEQIEGIDFKYADVKPLNEHETIEAAEKLFASYKDAPQINHIEQNRAYYTPMLDTVTMPLKGQFESIEKYYSTFAHELIHSTGHRTRLNRKEITSPSFMVEHSYAKEELVAEMGAAFICGILGIEKHIIDNSAAYLKGWRNRIAADNTLIMKAAGQAQKAADMVQGIVNQYEKKIEVKLAA